MATTRRIRSSTPRVRSLTATSFYRDGSDPSIDAAIAHHPLILEFLRQGQKDLISLNVSVTQLIDNFGA